MKQDTANSSRPPDGKGIRVLVVGRDPSLLRTREAILQGAGYAAKSVEAGSGLPDDAADADLVVLCQTLHERRAESLRKSLREKGSQAKFLQIVKRPSDDLDRFCSLDGPVAFLEKVAGMLQLSTPILRG